MPFRYFLGPKRNCGQHQSAGNSVNDDAVKSFMAALPPVVGIRHWTESPWGGPPVRVQTPGATPLLIRPVPQCQAQVHAGTARPPSPPPLIGSPDYGSMSTADVLAFPYEDSLEDLPPIGGTGNMGDRMRVLSSRYSPLWKGL
jgi:hypothetical protein